MTSNTDELLNQIENLKERLTSKEYEDMLFALKTLEDFELMGHRVSKEDARLFRNMQFCTYAIIGLGLTAVTLVFTVTNL